MAPWLRRTLWSLLAAGVLVLALEIGGGLLLGPPPSEARAWRKEPKPGTTMAGVEARSQALQRKMAALAPRGIHVVVDTAANRLYLKEGDKVAREAVVSCGSGNVLANPKGGKDWVFDTPRGEHKVETKVKKPLWVKPDWAFVEEGQEIPKKYADRVEEGVLGDYALGIGHGYFLHGTLYTRMLGRNVTHGCVRVGDQDLEALYRKVPLGAKVFIY